MQSFCSINFHRGSLAILRAALGGFFGAENGDAEVENFSIDGMEGFQAEGCWGGELGFATCDGFESGIEFFAHRIDGFFRCGRHFHAMAYHEEVIADLDAEAHGFIKSVVVQNRAHVEVVCHDETFEAHALAEEVADDDR